MLNHCNLPVVLEVMVLLTRFRLKLKKEGETARPFRNDLNQIPNNYTVEMTNRFKRLNLVKYLKKY